MNLYRSEISLKICNNFGAAVTERQDNAQETSK